jgi:hypothetical protein
MVHLPLVMLVRISESALSQKVKGQRSKVLRAAAIRVSKRTRHMHEQEKRRR